MEARRGPEDVGSRSPCDGVLRGGVGFGALLRVFSVVFGTLTGACARRCRLVAILIMVIITITQTDVKRLLTYSSITTPTPS